MATKEAILPRIKNHLNAHLFPKQYEKNFHPSLTIPDQSITVREILDRFAQGLPLGGQRTPIFEGENPFAIPENFSKMDLADREELIEQYQDAIVQVKQKAKNLAKAEREAAAAKYQADIEKAAKAAQNGLKTDPEDQK